MANTPIFQPVIKLTGERSEADKIAERMMWAMHREVIDTMNTERNAQTAIGISAIGTDCPKCLARHVSGLYDISDPSWKAQVGTFGHAGLEEHLRRRYARTPEERAIVRELANETATRYLWEVDPDAIIHLEEDVVLPVDGEHSIPGHCDLFIEGEGYGIVWDHKFLGASSLKPKAAGKIGPDYEHQLNGYGLGWELKGKLITHVALGALPRDGHVNDAAFVLQRYDRQMVIDRLAVIADLYASAALVGWERLIEAQPRASGKCWDCDRFESAENESFFAGFK
jgi:hypothetical protein